MQMAQEQVTDLRRKNARALQNIVEVRLGNASAARETSFGQFPALHAFLHVFNQSKLQRFEIHKQSYGMISP